MQTITEDYRELNRKLHLSNEFYGVSGKRYAVPIKTLSDALNTKDILDYGCGKRTLESALGFKIKNYDPCIEGFDEIPEAANIVACTDVLEHIEPDHLDDLLDDLKRVTKQIGYFVIATRPAMKFLEDGRNAHLIQKDINWWIPKLESRFDIGDIKEGNGEFAVIVTPKILKN